jgi:hypothetical protein
MERLDLWTAWLAGMIEGEGHLEFQRQSRSGRSRHGFMPRIGIASSDLTLLAKCQEILNAMHVQFGLSVSSTGNKLGKRVGYQIRIANHENVAKLLTTVRPFLVRLAPRADKILAWLELRAQHTGYNTPYTPTELKLADDIRATPTHGGIVLRKVA